jgi:hypothetical protein
VHSNYKALVNERIIGPLDLKTAGFGPQASLGKVDDPLGHLIVDGKPKAMLAGPNGDNSLVNNIKVISEIAVKIAGAKSEVQYSCFPRF